MMRPFIILGKQEMLKVAIIREENGRRNDESLSCMLESAIGRHHSVIQNLELGLSFFLKRFINNLNF